MAANNIFLVYLLVWSASWPVTLHTVEDDQQKNMGNSDVQAVQTSTGNNYLQTIVKTCKIYLLYWYFPQHSVFEH